MHSIAHIINPFRANTSSDLYIAQPITFRSMVQAKKMAAGVVNVELLSACFPEDTGIVPDDFRNTRYLERSVLDRHVFERPLKLPLLADILERLYAESTADYLIYTNVDIGLYPDFYIRVNEYINRGYDAFIINRRRVSDNYTKPDELEKIIRDPGKSHPGFDCFVFHRTLFPKFKLEGICIGVPFIEISFSQNLFAAAQKFRLFDKEFLTFHIGMELFKKRAPKEYYAYNKGQFWKLVPALLQYMDTRKFPYAHYIWPVRIIRWGLHPCIPIRLVAKLEVEKIKRKFRK